MTVHVGRIQTAITQSVSLTDADVEGLPVRTYLSGDDIRISSVHIGYKYDLEQGEWVTYSMSVSTRKHKKNGQPYDMRPSSAAVYPRSDKPVWGELAEAHRPTSVIQLVVGEF